MTPAVMSEMLDAVILGCGQIAGGYGQSLDSPRTLVHAQAFHRHPGFRLVACVEPDAARRASFMERWRVPRGYPDLAALHAADLPYDAAALCAALPAHAPLLETLLAGPVRGVLCEKPITDSPASANRLIEAYAAAGKVLAVNYTRRFDPSLQALAEEFRSGTWGRIRKVVGWYTRGVLNNGGHMVDLIAMLLGAPVLESVTARRDDAPAGDVTVDATLRLAGGARIYLVGGAVADYNHFELHILAEAGAVMLEESGFVIRRRPAGESPRFAGFRMLTEGTSEPSRMEEALAIAVDNLYRGITAGAPLLSDGGNALAALTLCHAMRERAAALPPEAP